MTRAAAGRRGALTLALGVMVVTVFTAVTARSLPTATAAPAATATTATTARAATTPKAAATTRAVARPAASVRARPSGAAGLTASTETAPAGRLIVLAASSLTESFTAAATAYERRFPGTTIEVQFAGSPTIVTQVVNGAPAGVVALADVPNMWRLRRSRAVETPIVFAGNRLAIVVPRGNPRAITKLADLTRRGLLIGLGGPAVPVGAYARQAFARAGLAVPDASQEQDVKAIVTKVALGELDAGVVYATDVRIGAAKVLGIDIPEAPNVVATYPAAVVKGTRNAALARSFVGWLRSAEAQRLLTGFGFLPAG